MKPEISKLFVKFNDGYWKLFLEKLELNNLRGWSGENIEFKFPVSVIVGANGSGKSTILRASACCYQLCSENKFAFYPSNLFINTQWDMAATENACITYRLKCGDRTLETRWKKTKEWGFTPRRKRPRRHVYFLDISRTLPLDAVAGYAKIAKLSNREDKNFYFDEDDLNIISYILGREYTNARFSCTEINSTRDIGIATSSLGEISQFHQGAGEDAILDTIRILKNIEKNSLLIIDEVEASLHPLAQRRFVHYLLKLSLEKRIQIILSTHSPFVLQELPKEARIMIYSTLNGRKILSNVSIDFALSSIDDRMHPELTIYVEDSRAEYFLIAIIRQSRCSDILRRIYIQKVGSDSIVKSLSQLIKNGHITKSICVFDGDKREEYGEDEIYLPGTVSPEEVVFTELKENNWCDLDNVFLQGAGELYQIFNEAMLLPDHHQWASFVGDRVKRSRDDVWFKLVDTWCKNLLTQNQIQKIVEPILEKLNINND